MPVIGRPDRVFSVRRAILLLDIASHRYPAVLVTSVVNEMRSHFRPADDQTTLYVKAFGHSLMLSMELAEGGEACR